MLSIGSVVYFSFKDYQETAKERREKVKESFKGAGEAMQSGLEFINPFN